MSHLARPRIAALRHACAVAVGPEEVVREALTRFFTLGDEEGAWELFGDDLVATPPSDFPESAEVRGKDELRRALRLSWGTVFGDDWVSRMSLRDVIPVDDRRAVGVTDFDPSGVRSGIQIETSPAAIYEVEEGRIVAVRMFLSGQDALRAAGIE